MINFSRNYARSGLIPFAAIVIAGFIAGCGGGDQTTNLPAGVLNISDARVQATAVQGIAPAAWTPGVLKATVLQGTSRLSSIELTVNERIDEASLFVVPEIAGVMQVSLQGLTVLNPGTPLSIPMELSASATTAPGLYEGTVHVQSGNRTMPAALKVQIQVVQGSSTKVVNEVADPSPDRVARTPSGQFLIKDEVLVVINGDVVDPATRIKEIAASTGAVIVGSVPDSTLYQLRFVGADVATIALHRDALRVLTGVKAVSLSLLGTGLKTYDKGLYKNQWGYDASAVYQARHLDFIHAPEAWDITTGAMGADRILVAVIDDDFDFGHEDLKDNIDTVHSDAPLDARGTFSGKGHGTGVAGTICADGHNDFGVVGVAWTCTLLLYKAHAAYWDWETGGAVVASYIKCLPFTNKGIDRCIGLMSLPRMLISMQKAVADEARVVNISLGFVEPNCRPNCTEPPPVQVAKDANMILRAGFAADTAHRVLWVIAAGNEGRDTLAQSPASFPQQYPEFQDRIIVVAGVNIRKDTPLPGPVTVMGQEPNWLSNKAASNFGDFVDVAAPWDVSTTFPRLCKLVDEKEPGKGYECDHADEITTFGSSTYVGLDTTGGSAFGGTSAAAPQVAGLAALVMSRPQYKSAADAKKCIVESASAYGAKAWLFNPDAGNPWSVARFGVIHAAKAVECSPKPADPIVLFDNFGDKQFCSLGGSVSCPGVPIGLLRGFFDIPDNKAALAFHSPPGIAADLTSIELPVYFGFGTNQIAISVRSDIAGLPGSTIATVTRVDAMKRITSFFSDPTFTTLLIAFEPGEVVLQEGRRYWVEVHAPISDTYDGVWSFGRNALFGEDVATSGNGNPYSLGGYQYPAMRVIVTPR